MGREARRNQIPGRERRWCRLLPGANSFAIILKVYTPKPVIHKRVKICFSAGGFPQAHIHIKTLIMPKSFFAPPPTQKISLPTSTSNQLFYTAAQTLEAGDQVVYESILPGADGKAECLGLRSWLYWERKRRVRDALEAGGEAAGADTLVGTHTSLQRLSDGRWGLVVKKIAPGKITVTRADGRVETNE